MKQPQIFLKELPKYATLQALAKRYPSADPQALACYVVLVRVTGEILADLDRLLSKHRLSRGRLSVLYLLNQPLDTGYSPFDLAKKSGVTRATMTGLLDGLERDGLITRAPSGADRRMRVIKLTAKGRKLLDQVLPLHYRKIRELFSGLSKPQQVQLLNLLTRMGVKLPGFRRLE